MSCLAGPIAVEGPLVCSLGKARFHARPVLGRARLCPTTQRHASCQGVLLAPVLGRRVGQPTLAIAQRQEAQPGKEPRALLAPLPQWCHRLAGAFVLVPVLFFGGSSKALAQPLRTISPQASCTTSNARHTPLYEVSALGLRDSPQARVAATLATAMIGYGLVRSSSSGLRSSVAADAAAGGGTAVALAGPPPPSLPQTTQARLERLDQLYREIEALKRRNDELWKLAMEFLAEDATLSVKEATVKAAQSLDLPAEAADAVLAEKVGTDPRALLDRSVVDADAAAALSAGLPSARPSGGATRGIAPGSAAADDVMASAAASVASSVAQAAAARAPVRPSGGASRLATPPSGAVGGQVDSRVPPMPIPERPGGASARSGPSAPPPAPYMPPDSSRVMPVDVTDSTASAPGPNLAAWAGDVVRQAASGLPPPPPPVLPPPPPQDVLRPSIRPTRRVTGTPPRQPRTFRAISPPPLPTPPPARVRPSFDVPADAPSPEAYLQEAQGLTADGRVNPSFASSSSLPSAVTAAAEPAPTAAASAPPPVPPTASGPTAAASVSVPPPPPAITDAAPPTIEPMWWYNPLSWFTHRESAAGGGNITNPSFDASWAVEAEQTVEVVRVKPAAKQPAPPPPQKPEVPVAVAVGTAGEAPPAVALAATLVEVALTKGAGVGAAGAAESASWSTALTEGPAPNDFSPVERVAELLEVATKTEEYTFPKYDPLRNLLADVSAPSSAHKYDMLRGLLRSGREERAEEGQTEPQARKYDLVYDLLQSLRTSGDPTAILATSDPKFDPVWSLLNMRVPAPGTLTKYDLVGSLLQAALAASPQPSRYDPLAVLLQMQPITGRFKYCLADVLLHGGWQKALDAGLTDLPTWDPMTAVVGVARAQPPPPPGGGRRPVNKYDMVGQALEAAAGLPEELSSGRWAAQPRDPLLRSATEVVTAAATIAAAQPGGHQPPSKYDMVSQALAAAAALPEDLSSGKWAAAQGGREIIVDTAIKAVEGTHDSIVTRVRNSSVAAWRAVTSVTSPVSNAVAKALGMPYEVAPGVVMKVERPRGSGRGGPLDAHTTPVAAIAAVVGASPLPLVAPTSTTDSGSEDEDLPALVFQFKAVESSATSSTRPKIKGRKSGPVTVTARSWQQRAVRPPSRAAAGAESMPSAAVPRQDAAAASQVPQAGSATSQRLDRAVVPPSRIASRRVTASAASAAMAPAPVSHPDTDSEAVLAALTATEQESGVMEASTLAAAAVLGALPAEVAVKPQAETALLSEPLNLSELAVDLLVDHGASRPSINNLVARFGPGFREVAAQLCSVRGDAALMARHPAVARVMRAASANAGDSKGMWSHLYDMVGAVQEAEAAMPGFLSDCRASYPVVHELLTTGDATQALNVLCTLSNLMPDGSSVSEGQ